MGHWCRLSNTMNIANNFYYDWPLVTIISGGHEPQWVEDVLARVNALDDEILAVITGYMIMVAKEEMGRN